jgi:hypothetical protein
VLAGALYFAVNAQQDTGMSGMGQGGMKMSMGGMMDSSAMCNMMMMHFMKPSFAFSTKDGGFVVIVGNKIMKYDKEANLKKEVEMKMDTVAMDRMMQQMKSCPMMKKK